MLENPKNNNQDVLKAVRVRMKIKIACRHSRPKKADADLTDDRHCCELKMQQQTEWHRLRRGVTATSL